VRAPAFDEDLELNEREDDGLEELNATGRLTLAEIVQAALDAEREENDFDWQTVSKMREPAPEPTEPAPPQPSEPSEPAPEPEQPEPAPPAPQSAPIRGIAIAGRKQTISPDGSSGVLLEERPSTDSCSLQDRRRGLDRLGAGLKLCFGETFDALRPSQNMIGNGSKKRNAPLAAEVIQKLSRHRKRNWRSLVFELCWLAGAGHSHNDGCYTYSKYNFSINCLTLVP
jgi:hypothetical protein